MREMLLALLAPLAEGFVRRALGAGLALGSAAALLGVFIVQRGLGLLSDGLAHATFGGLALGLLLGAAADDYREAIEATARELDRADIPVPRTRLCFDYVHMNNNRFGVKPVEEAYLAALLAAAL